MTAIPNRFRCAVLAGTLLLTSQLPVAGQGDRQRRHFVNNFFSFPHRAFQNQNPWSLKDFTYNVDQSIRIGFDTIGFVLPWNTVQDEDSRRFDWSWLDTRLDYVFKHRDASVMVIAEVTGQALPKFVDIEAQGMRGVERALWHYPGRDAELCAMSVRLAIDSPKVQEWVTNYYRALAAHVREKYGPDHRVIAYQVSLHRNMESDWFGLGPQVDYSDHAQQAFRRWLQRRYGSIEELNRCWGTVYSGPETKWQGWVTPRYTDFDQIRMSHRNEAFVRRVDWLKYKYDSMDDWNRQLSNALREGDPQAKLLWRGGGGLLMHERTVDFDLARYSGNIDWLFMNDYLDDFSFSYFRAAMQEKPWGIETGPGRRGDFARRREHLVDLARRIFEQGGAAVNFVYYNTQDIPRGVAPYDPQWGFLSEIAAMAQKPRTVPRAHKAVYVSTFQTLRDSEDFFAAHAAFDRLHADGTVVDVISDGFLAKMPDRLKQYDGGIVIPLAEVLSQEARAALLRASRSGVRLELHKLALTGTLDEYGRRTRALSEELTR